MTHWTTRSEKTASMQVERPCRCGEATSCVEKQMHVHTHKKQSGHPEMVTTSQSNRRPKYPKGERNVNLQRPELNGHHACFPLKMYTIQSYHKISKSLSPITVNTSAAHPKWQAKKPAKLSIRLNSWKLVQLPLNKHTFIFNDRHLFANQTHVSHMRLQFGLSRHLESEGTHY